MVAVMSALYVDVWPQPTAPVSVVRRTKHTNSLANVSRLAIFIMLFLGGALVKLARLPVHDPSGRFRAATAVPRKSEPQGSAD